MAGVTTTPKVLVTVPCLALAGGVANYYRTLRPLLGSDIRYLEIGARPGEHGPVATLRRLVSDCRELYRSLQPGTCDLLHVNPSLAWRSVPRDGLFILIARLRRTPVLVFFRGWNPAMEARLRGPWRILFRAVYDQAACILVLAQEFAATLRELGFRAPIETETTVVADAAFDVPLPAARDTLNILYLSRLDRGKGVMAAIEAFALLHARCPDTRLVVAGDGPDRASAEALVTSRRLDGITFTGHVEGEAKHRLFSGADLFFFPTGYWEGMPNAVLEAMGYALPVVTCPVGGIRDFFEPGRMGFLAGSDDPPAHADSLERLVKNPQLRRDMGLYNRRYARERFAASGVAARLMRRYAELVWQVAPH